MEMVAMQSKTPVFGAHIRIKPAIQHPFPKSLLGAQEFRRIQVTICKAAGSGYPKRRPKKSLIPRTKSPPRRGFTPKPQVETDTPKKDQSSIEEMVVREIGKTDLDLQPNISDNSMKTREAVLDNVVKNDESTGTSEDETKVFASAGLNSVKQEMQSAEKTVVGKMEKTVVDRQSNFSRSSVKNQVEILDKIEDNEGPDDHTENGDLAITSVDLSTHKQKENLAKVKVDKIGNTEVDLQSGISSNSVQKRVVISDRIENLDDSNDILQDEASLTTPTTFGYDKQENMAFFYGDSTKLERQNQVEEVEGRDHASELNLIVERDAEVSNGKEAFMKQEEHLDPQAQWKLLELLAEQNLVSGKKMFVFPEVVKAANNIEVFLNRNSSALVNENEILIKGAFNGWRWKSFTENMHKTDLKGDWWSCQLYVPKEVYRIDFVFFNGGNVYENNNYNDFLVPVEGGLDESEFEGFLLEEKRKELEKLAVEQAERERQAEEQRRREAEKAAREADLAQAKMEVQKRRESIHQVLKFAAKSVDGLWHIVPSIFKGDMVRIYYRRNARPLEHASEIWIHGGHNNWSDGLTIVEKLQRSEEKDGDWWYTEVIVPDGALILDWVFANGPPRGATIYDNNNKIDFHAILPSITSEEHFWIEEEQKIYKKLQEERKQKEEADRRKAERSAQMKAETRERSIKRFLLAQKDIVYTDPIEVRAGKLVTVFYNPSRTVLSGKPEVWFRCSFNHWTHRDGPLPPHKMEHVDNSTHLKTTVKIPPDAYMMDFVFSEREDGGIYDNKNGMDYHIPVIGGIVKEPPLHVVHVAVEMAPIAKVGGLGDVVTSLSRAIQELGHTVDIIFPKYDCMNLSNVKDFHFCQSFFWGGTEIKVWFGKVEGISVYFLEPQNGIFWVGCIYGRNDADRFGFFCHAALEFLLQTGIRPDILHCHDWSSAPVAWLFKEHYRHYGLGNARVIFTIHNLEFGAGHIAKAMQHADKATTVSDTYSKEVSGNPVISPHLYKFHGILNGIDPDIWDPYNDNFIPVAYTSENVVQGKKAAKEALQQRLGLKTSDQPLVGVITRLTVQKGIHLIKHAIWRTLDCNGQVVLLGSAPDPRIQNDFVNLAKQLHSSHGDRVRLCLTYDEPLSHLIYAGSDFILVPSIFEPCGLTQLVAMRYGSIPIVRKTGGLYDTVFDVDNDKERAQAQGLEPNGFSFDGADTAGVDYALNRAINAWYDSREWFNSLCKHVMQQDWSWNRPALDYMELYHAARK